MIHTKPLLLLAAAALLVACGQEGEPDTSDLQTDAQKFGYAIGVDIGKSLKPVKDDVDMAALQTGLHEALEGQAPRLDDQAREKIKSDISRKLQQKQMEERLAKAQTAKDSGAQFLADNGKRDGVQTTASGLQYEVVTEGSGGSPKASDKVTVHYKGTLINGDVFDSSYERGQPVSFPLGNVIAGWTEGLQLMKVGGKAKLYIPPELGYGERGAGAKIGPNETLVFEVELLSIDAASGEKKKSSGE